MRVCARSILKMKEALMLDPETHLPLPHERVTVNGQTIGFLNGLEAHPNESDEIHLLPPVAEG